MSQVFHQKLKIKTTKVSKNVFISWHGAGNTKGGRITVPLTSCLTGLDESVLQIITKIVSWHTAYSKPVQQEVNGTVILPPLVFPAWGKFPTLLKTTLLNRRVWRSSDDRQNKAVARREILLGPGVLFTTLHLLQN
jgi:hypothetical protein